MNGYYFIPREYEARMPQAAPTFQDKDAFLRDLLKAIYNERQAQLEYQALYLLAHTEFQKKTIKGIHDDEVKHERMFTALYRTLTGHSPQVPAQGPVQTREFLSGLRAAFEDEVDAAEFYRSMYLNAHLRWMRDQLFEIMTDEMEHAQRLTFIRAEL